MNTQAKRRSPAFFRARAFWRGLDLASQAELALAAVVILGWAALSFALPLVLA